MSLSSCQTSILCVNIKHITATVWAVNYTQNTETKSSKLATRSDAYEQLRGGSLGAVWAVKWGVDFYGGAGDANIKTANFPNLQRTKNER